MNYWIFDAYRTDNHIILWAKTKEGNVRLERSFATKIYMESSGEDFCQTYNLPYSKTTKKNYLSQDVDVLEIEITNLQLYETIVRKIEKLSKHSLTLYNADIAPEQEFFYKYHLYPGVYVDENLHVLAEQHPVSLTTARLKITSEQQTIQQIEFNTQIIQGTEQEILKQFTQLFQESDPDVLIMDFGFAQLPFLAAKLEWYNIACSFHRYDSEPIQYKGGKSFYSYGQVQFRDYAIRLHGRFLIDTNSTIGSQCDIDGILELCELTGARFQQMASRSFGATFQYSLIRLMYSKDMLIPYKEKPVDLPLSMYHLLKGDRAGHTFDARVGFHKDVAEIDFSSMFPWIIYNKNISAETILSGDAPFEEVPGLPITISHAKKGLIPEAIKPILDRRMYYKKNRSSMNDSRAQALKYVLVTAYGYLRFREFKLGIATSHMAICAYARDIILQSARLAESRGFEVVHGIVDSLYIKKKGVTSEEVKAFCQELGGLVGIPVASDGIFKWIVFLPSINNPDRPLPATYYGVFTHGDLKVRGIEVRQRKTPPLVKYFQQEVLNMMQHCNSKKEIVEQLEMYCSVLRRCILSIERFPVAWLLHKIQLSQETYKHNIPQKKITEQLQADGITIRPGMFITYLMQEHNCPVMEKQYSGKPDRIYYQSLLIRSLLILLQPFGIDRKRIVELVGMDTQLRITDYMNEMPVFLAFENQIKADIM